MKPAEWPADVWTKILAILGAYIYKWSGADSESQLSQEARDEIRSRIILDIMTGEIPPGMEPMHYVFRKARQWRVRGWNGDCELDRDRKRAERARARKNLRDPGSMDSEEGKNKSPYRGVSDDARQPTPLAILIAIESATTDGLRYTSDRQRKARRKPVKGKPGPVRFRTVPTGHSGRKAGFSPSGRPLYYPGARTLLSYVPEAPEYETGPRGKPHIPYVGNLAHRAIGKVKAPPMGTDGVGRAMARMAIVGRTPRARFIPAPPPAPAVPAMAGQGTSAIASYAPDVETYRAQLAEYYSGR